MQVVTMDNQCRARDIDGPLAQHRGRTMMVVETRVSDATGPLLIVVTTTRRLVGK